MAERKWYENPDAFKGPAVAGGELRSRSEGPKDYVLSGLSKMLGDDHKAALLAQKLEPVINLPQFLYDFGKDSTLAVHHALNGHYEAATDAGMKAGIGAAAMALPVAGSAVASRIARNKVAPAVQNKVYRESGDRAPMDFGAPDMPEYAMRNVFSDAELASIRETGRMLPAPPAMKRGVLKPAKGTKYFTGTDTPTGQTLRVKTSNISEHEPVDARFVDILDPKTGAYKPILKAKGGAITIDDGNPAKRRKLI